MRFVIKHEIKGRLRVHILQSRMSFAQADTLQYYLDGQSNIVSAKIQERTLDVTVVYTGSREEALKTLEILHIRVQKCRRTILLIPAER